MTTPDPDIELGFAGLLLLGVSKDDAYERIRQECSSPDVKAIINILLSTPEGRASLAWSADRWKEHGFAPPWAEL